MLCLIISKVCTGAKSEHQSKLAARKVLESHPSSTLSHLYLMLFVGSAVLVIMVNACFLGCFKVHTPYKNVVRNC